MEVEFQYLQVRAAGDDTTALRGAFDAPGRLQVDGSLMTTLPNIESIAHAGKLVYDLTQEYFPDELDWWGVEYFYTLSHPTPTGLMVREMRPGDSGFFIARLGTPFAAGDGSSERFKGYLENSPYCYMVGWTGELLQVQLAEVALPHDRAQIHSMLLNMYMR